MFSENKELRESLQRTNNQIVKAKEEIESLHRKTKELELENAKRIPEEKSFAGGIMKIRELEETSERLLRENKILQSEIRELRMGKSEEASKKTTDVFQREKHPEEKRQDIFETLSKPAVKHVDFASEKSPVKEFAEERQISEFQKTFKKMESESSKESSSESSSMDDILFG